MEENKEFIASYSTLFELLRREKDREELQKLEQTFFDDVKNYIQQKQSSTQQLTNFEDKNKIDKELNNIQKILKELYEKREKKIVSMALDKSRIKTNIVDSASMLTEEKELFDSLVSVLDENRNIIALRLFSQEPAKEEPKVEQKPEEPKTEVKEEPQVEVKQEPKAEEQPAEEQKPEPIQEPEKTETIEKKETNTTKLVRFIHAVPKFVGKELEEYGPFEEEDVANLPAEIAQLLIDKQRAEEIEQ